MDNWIKWGVPFVSACIAAYNPIMGFMVFIFLILFYTNKPKIPDLLPSVSGI